MNKTHKDYYENQFFFPESSGVYTSRCYSILTDDKKTSAVSSYYKNGEEGIVFVENNKCKKHSVLLFKSQNNCAINPSLAMDKNKKIYGVWSEFDKKWKIKIALMKTTEKTEVLKEIVFDCFKDNKKDLLTPVMYFDQKNTMHVICESMDDSGNCDIIDICCEKNVMKNVKTISKGSGFSKRPQIKVFNDVVFVVWDQYENKSYDIYLAKCKNGKWNDPIRVSRSNSWELHSSTTVDTNGRLWISYLRNIDVIRDGVISKKNEIMVAKYENDVITHINGIDKNEYVISLNLGLLPAKTYFGYNGLRRNPQIACCENGQIGLFWEMQRDENEVWDNVTNGWFCCMWYDGHKWSSPQIIHSGYSCFYIDTKNTIKDKIYYTCRGKRENGTDIHFFDIAIEDLQDFALPIKKEWNQWKKIDLPLSNKLELKEGNDLKIYWGDFHCHSIFSPDAEGFPDELYFYARDKAGLSFSGITDNDFYPDNIMKKSYSIYQQSLCDSISKNGEFLAYTGFEWTFHNKSHDKTENYNHRSIIFLNNAQPIARRCDSSGNTEERFINTMENTKSMWHSHHGNWDILSIKHDLNVEVASGWSLDIEKSKTINRNLDKGWIFGFTASSDNHRYNPGYGGALTAVKSKELSKVAIYNALKLRRNYATSGNRSFLDFKINGHGMGEIIFLKNQEKLECFIQCDSKIVIDYISIICNGKELNNISISNKQFKKTLDLPLINKDTYFYIKVKLAGESKMFPHNISQAEGLYLWSSPIWVKIPKKEGTKWQK